jgi:hypothetical protein
VFSAVPVFCSLRNRLLATLNRTRKSLFPFLVDCLLQGPQRQPGPEFRRATPALRAIGRAKRQRQHRSAAGAAVATVHLQGGHQRCVQFAPLPPSDFPFWIRLEFESLAVTRLCAFSQANRSWIAR